MKDFFFISFEGRTPLVATAIHDGHRLGEPLEKRCALTDAQRLREEDPFTGTWTAIADNRLIAHHSRFEVDLNRPPDKAIYLEPGDAWGLNVWHTRPSAEMQALTMKEYANFYDRVHEKLTGLTGKFGSVVVLDLHSYCYRRNGQDAPPEEDALNPEINVGTGTMPRENWARLVDRFMGDLRQFDFQGRSLDVRENVKFKGGYFPRWIHENFRDSVCCLSIEARKFFMDEWTGEPYPDVIKTVGEALRSTLPGILEELSSREQ